MVIDSQIAGAFITSLVALFCFTAAELMARRRKKDAAEAALERCQQATEALRVQLAIQEANSFRGPDLGAV